MSGEHTSINSNYQTADADVKKKRSNKVDINILLNRIRTDQKKEKFENILFVGLISFLVVVTGVIVSL